MTDQQSMQDHQKMEQCLRECYDVAELATRCAEYCLAAQRAGRAALHPPLR